MFTDTASDSDCSNECPTKPLADYVNGNGGFAGIHGSYACPADYPACAGKTNTFETAIYNSRLNKWMNDIHWSGAMIYYDGSYHYRQGAGRIDGISAGIVNYPGLVNEGNISVEGGVDAKQGSKNTKGGMGFNDSNIFLVVAYGVDMNDFAAVFKALGAKYALNLDGGGSVAIYQGGYKAGPGRALPNAIIFK